MLEADAARMDPRGWVAADAERLAQAETAQEAIRNKRKLEAFDDLLAACKLALRFSLGDNLRQQEVANYADQLAEAIIKASPQTR